MFVTVLNIILVLLLVLLAAYAISLTKLVAALKDLCIFYKERSAIIINIEKINDQYVAYEKFSSRFMCQGNTIEELATKLWQQKKIEFAIFASGTTDANRTVYASAYGNLINVGEYSSSQKLTT